MPRAMRLAGASALACVVAMVSSTAAAAAPPAKDILAAAGVKGGLVVHLGCGDGTLTAALRASGSYLVHGLDADAANVAKARAHVHSRGLDGRVSVSRLSGERLPFVDNLASLVVISGKCPVSSEEIARVLAPRGVVLFQDRSLDTRHSTLDTQPVAQPSGWVKAVKPRPKDIDEWTHYLHDASNNAVAHDTRVGPPRHMQWLADPSWTRNHHTLASISSVVATGGRIFYIVDEATGADMAVVGNWSLVGRDAFSGTMLWKRPMASWAWHRQKFRSGPVQLPRMLVAAGERVFAPLGLGAPVSALDAATGETVRTFQGTDNAEEIVFSGSVLLVVAGSPMAEHAGVGPKRGPFPNQKAIVAFRAPARAASQGRGEGAETGEPLWRWAEPAKANLMPLTLAAAGSRAFFQAGRGVVCLDLTSGKEQWRSGPLDGAKAGAEAKGKGRKRRGIGRRSLGWSTATLVVSAPLSRGGEAPASAGEGGRVVLWADGGRLTALAAATGKTLWDCPCPAGFRSPSDVFVIGGLVWLGSGFSSGRDLRTGEVTKQTPLLKLIQTAGHHHRCYREKATDRYIMTSHRGIEFLDLVGTNHTRNNWIRGVCQYGIMPCNGLVYCPSHTCGCYMEAKLYGFWAVAAAAKGRGTRDEGRADNADRLERGPAYGSSLDTRTSTLDTSSDWPTYRHDALRSGSTAAAVPATLRQAWAARVAGRLSAPVVAGGLVVVASVDTHRVTALGAEDGTARWTFQAGGRVDSPPTIWQGRVLFGSADGSVTCLRARDGALAWRFRAAPEDRRTVAYDQVESVWPAHGSVLVDGGVAYVAAGRSTYLDGGIALYGLDPATGKVVCQTRLRSDHPGPGDPEQAKQIPSKRIAQNTVDHKSLKAPDLSDSFSMAGGTRTDLLVGDGASIYLRQMRFSRRLERQKGYGRHLFSTTTLLDDTEIHRTHRVLGSANFSRIPVAYSWIANRPNGAYGSRLAVPYGLMLAFDGQTAWGIRRIGGYVLFAERHQPLPSAEQPPPDFRTPVKGAPPRWAWSVKVALRPRALVRAGERLLLGGMPRVAGEEAEAAFEGRKGGVLLIASAADGKAAAGYALPAPPVWDGMAVAGRRLILCTTDGRVLCLAPDGKTPLEPYAAANEPATAPRPSPAGPARARSKPTPVRPDKDGKLVLNPGSARTTGRLRYQPDRENLGSWTNPQDYCEWTLQGVRAGTYAVDIAYGSTQKGVGYTLVVGDQRLAGTVQPTGGVKAYKSFRVGTLTLPAGTCTLAVKPGPFQGAIMNFRLLTLTPAP